MTEVTQPASLLLVPAPRLGSRRSSGSKIGSRATPLVTGNTEGQQPSAAAAASASSSPYYSVTPRGASAAQTPRAAVSPAPEAAASAAEAASPAAAPAAGVATAQPAAAASPAKATHTIKKAATPRSPSQNSTNGESNEEAFVPAAAPVSTKKAKKASKSNTPAAGRSRSGSQVSSGEINNTNDTSDKKSEAGSTNSKGKGASSGSLKRLSIGSPKFSGNVSISATPLIYRARTGVVVDDGVVPAGVPYRSKYAVSRSTVRAVAGRSYVDSDIHSLSPVRADAVSPRPQCKRVMDVAYTPTRVGYTNEESRRAQLEERLGGKRCNAPHTNEAPWDHEHPKPGSPKRVGSCKPPVTVASNPPWTREDDGFSHNRSTRSHTACAAARTIGSPYGVTEGDDRKAFGRGDDKLVETARGLGERPNLGKAKHANPVDNDILNPDAPMGKASPSGRRPPPPSAWQPSEEYVRPLSRKSVEQVEHFDRPIGKQCNGMAGAACEGSPFRMERDDVRVASLSPERRNMGAQPKQAPKPFSKVFMDGLSGGVQSYHIDPSVVPNSQFSPPRERKTPAKQGKSNIESLPGTDRDSLRTVCPVRATYHTETLTGVMYAAPMRAMPPYTVVAPYWTAAGETD